MKKKIITLSSLSLVVAGFLVYLVIDNSVRVHHFRTMQDSIASSENVDLKGLRDIKASGSSLPGYPNLKNRLSLVPEKIIVIDSFQEPHGYINGVSSTFLGYHLASPSIRHVFRRLIQTGTLDNLNDQTSTESQEAKKFGFDYKLFNIGSKKMSPDSDIDAIVEFFDTVQKDNWIHVHCAHGKGRTSMILVMLDIFHNAPHVSLKDIVMRQHLLGSENLFDTRVWLRSNYSEEQLLNRKNFIVNFYDFISQRKAGGIQKWSEWKVNQKMGER